MEGAGYSKWAEEQRGKTDPRKEFGTVRIARSTDTNLFVHNSLRKGCVCSSCGCGPAPIAPPPPCRAPHPSLFQIHHGTPHHCL